MLQQALETKNQCGRVFGKGGTIGNEKKDRNDFSGSFINWKLGRMRFIKKQQ